MQRRQGESLIRVLTKGEKAALAHSEFRCTSLDHVDMTAADLRGAIFERVSLVGADFSDSDLRGASFRSCDLRHARFGDSRWGANSFAGSLFTSSSGLAAAQVTNIVSLGGRFVEIRGENAPSAEEPTRQTQLS